MQQPDQQFAGVISGYQTLILLNSQRLKIQLEPPSKESLYERTIQYNSEDEVHKQVKKTFENLYLLFDYINGFSQDPQRIKFDLLKSQLKIVNNPEPRRMKNAPVLIIPLTKKFLFEDKIKSQLQKDIELTLKHSQILEFKFRDVKRRRKNLIERFNDLQRWMIPICCERGIQFGEEENIDGQKQNDQSHRIQRDSSFQKDLDKLLLRVDQLSHINEQESLFFESQPLVQNRNSIQREDYRAMSSQYIQGLSANHYQGSSMTYDPFSYL